MRRHEKMVSTAGHEAVMLIAVPYLQATLVTGYLNGRCGPWAESQQKAQLNDLMGRI